MFDLINPCGNPNAWWQQLIMLGLPLLLGYLWGKGNSGAATVAELDPSLSAKLNGLNADLDACRAESKAIESSTKIAAPAMESVVANSLTAAGAAAAAVTLGDKSKIDDLKVVEGIGPKIESLFNEAGIWSFAQLAATSPERLKEILEAAGSRFQIHNPTTWPAQASLADKGNWEELKKWQEELNAGNA
jgi:predicted flap endonuclease-1-like 5' DNA nuclease